MTRKWFAALAAALILACGTAAAQTAPKILRVVPSADPAELDPTKGMNLISRIYSQMVFDTLFALDSHLTPRPLMVDTEQVSADGLTYTFTLRSGLKFHDDSPITSRDVVASLQRWMNGVSMGPQLKTRTASLDVVDDRTFRLVLKRRFGLVEFMLSGPGAPIAGIMREADAKRPPDTPMTAPIGSGPFRYVPGERVSGHRVVFEKFRDYLPRNEPPDGLAGGRIVKVDRVEWIIMPDAITAANALIKGEVDFWEQVTPDLTGMLRQQGVVVKRIAALPTVAFIRPNFQLPPFNDIRARQALAYLFDQKEMMEAAAGNGVGWQECHSFSVCGGPYGTEIGSQPYRTPDIAKAKELLQQAGYKGEKIVLLGTPQLPAINAMTLVAAQRLKQAGMNVDVQMTDFAVMFQRMQAANKPLDQGGYNLFAYHATGNAWFHPLMNLSLDLSCNGKNWAGWPCDPQGEALRQAFLDAPDDAARQAAFVAFQQRLWQFLPYIPLGQFDVDVGWRKQITGVLNAYITAYWNIDKP
ncbi:MAG TPA: ABC transporter substrate-binding protein [Acetobacteraceae bacterium]|nr:ABC transporter substrate-binding protein [Acetobacteraceae bacterium]